MTWWADGSEFWLPYVVPRILPPVATLANGPGQAEIG